MEGPVGLGIWLLRRRWEGLDMGEKSVGKFGVGDVEIRKSIWSIGKY